MLNYTQASDEMDHLARWLQALSHPKRLAILNMLMEGVQCNCEIHERLGLSLSLISHHMRILEEIGLVVSQRDAVDARWIYYFVNQESLRKLRGVLSSFLDAERIQPRQPHCGPRTCNQC
jgi:ArsR family transcriptional regulator